MAELLRIFDRVIFFEEVAVCWMINTGALGRNRYLSFARIQSLVFEPKGREFSLAAGFLLNSCCSECFLRLCHVRCPTVLDGWATVQAGAYCQ